MLHRVTVSAEQDTVIENNCRYIPWCNGMHTYYIYIYIGGVHVRAHVKLSKFCKGEGQATFLHIMNPHALETLKQQ